MILIFSVSTKSKCVKDRVCRIFIYTKNIVDVTPYMVFPEPIVRSLFVK